MLDLSSLPSLPETIARNGLLARKSLGQHFLLDGRITDRIARYAGDLAGYHVIEIGPGPGGLTRSLLTMGATSLYVIEKDARCIAIMEELKAVAGNALHIMQSDALYADILSVPAPRKIVANLPYNIGTQLLLNWMDILYRQGQGAITSLTLMFQKEVAGRIVAPPGGKDYGKLSVLCQWLCECRWDMELPPGAFSPPPKVSSAVITLTPREKPLVDVPKEALEKVMATAFGKRRKMLRQALKSLGAGSDALLEKSGVDGTLRAEQLDVLTLCTLAKTYHASQL